MKKEIAEKFKNPETKYRGRPFWSWNGKLEKKELLRQIETFKEMGMGGYFCHSRIGLITEYLGDEWFELINACADKGQELGLETWLYDEDRWPSGTAGGFVTQHPEYRLQYLRLSVLENDEYSEGRPGVIAAFSVTLDGLSFTNKKRLFKGDVPSGNKVLIFTTEEMNKDPFYNGYTYVDTMNPEATNKFIELTHEKYKEKCGDKFGKSIQGIFTDEPHRGSVMNGFSISNPDSFNLTPYTNTLFDDFTERFGHDLRDCLPELFLWKDGQKVSPVKWQYMELICSLFLQNFMRPMHDWCRANNLKLTGHLLHEDTLVAQACMMGSLMRGYEYMDCPGIDILGEENNRFWNVKQLSSAARQLGKTELLCEMYACIGWHTGFKEYKAIGDWHALFGVNMRCHHLSWYSMKGSGKRDYPASISGQSSWYEKYKYIEDYYARIHVMMEQGEACTELLVVNPIESTWVSIYPGWSRTLATVDEDVKAIEQQYFQTFSMLCERKIDFDYGDEDFLHRFGKVEIVDGQTVLTVGKASYKSVLLTGLLTVRGTTLNLLEEFIKQGGHVVFAGDLPAYTDALPSNRSGNIGAVCVPYEAEAIADNLKVSRLVQVTDSSGNEVSHVYAQARKSSEGYIVLIMNMERHREAKNCTVTLPVGGYCERFNVRTGEISLMAKGAESISFPFDFAPSQELMLFVTDKNNGYQEEKTVNSIEKQIKLKERFAYELHEPNVCTLSIVNYKIDGGQWVTDKHILTADMEVRKTFGMNLRGGEGLQPWFAAKSGRKVECSLALSYVFHAEAIPEKISIAVEAPEDFIITVNGQKALTVTNERWVDCCYTVLTLDTAALRLGRNEIVLTAEFEDKINPEAIHLLGDFGAVVKDGMPTITAKPEKITKGDLTAQGFAFYGGAITYFETMPAHTPEQSVLISVNKPGCACIEVSGREKKELLAFYPFTADITVLAEAGDRLGITCYLTRKNTFESTVPDQKGGYVQTLLENGLPEDMHFIIAE